MAIEVFVANEEGFEDGSRRMVRAAGRQIGVFKLGGEYYAYENECVHQGGPVCYGEILGRVEAVLGPGRDVLTERFSDTEVHVVCPWHGYEYDIRTGRCAADPQLRLRCYGVTRHDGSVFVVV